MLQPKELVIKDQQGIDRKYIISKMPYSEAGREVCTQYITTALPKIGDYQLNEKLLVKMFGYISAVTEDREIRLVTKALIDNHVPDFQTGIKLEKEMLQYNLGDIDTASFSKSINDIKDKAKPIIHGLLDYLKDVIKDRKES